MCFHLHYEFIFVKYNATGNLKCHTQICRILVCLLFYARFSSRMVFFVRLEHKNPGPSIVLIVSVGRKYGTMSRYTPKDNMVQFIVYNVHLTADNIIRLQQSN